MGLNVHAQEKRCVCIRLKFAMAAAASDSTVCSSCLTLVANMQI